MEKTKYYLIKLNHGSCVMGPSWYEKKGTWWVNTNGGRMQQDPTDEILQTAEVEDVCDLDWEPVLIREGAGSGWLGRNAEWFECSSKEHDDVASLVIKKSVRELEETGWVRVDYSAEVVLRVPDQGRGWRISSRFNKRLSVDQRNWLSRKGYVVREED